MTPPVLDFRITLEARNPARRCLRQYRVEAGTDLSGVWVVEISNRLAGISSGKVQLIIQTNWFYLGNRK